MSEVKDERERQHGDDYLILAAHYALDLFLNDRSDKRGIFDAIVLLEYCLTKSKFNYVAKLLLIRLYFELGVCQRSLDLADSLDIKQIQRDTLSYLFTTNLESYGGMGSAIRRLKQVLTIYDKNQSETPEMILQAFKFGSFSKIPEFIDFKKRLDYSIQRAVTHRQIFRAELLSCATLAETIQKVTEFSLEDLSLDGHCPFLSSFILM
jgi:N-terminal acetyltransferase B complex non-catalytic subunit